MSFPFKSRSKLLVHLAQQQGNHEQIVQEGAKKGATRNLQKGQDTVMFDEQDENQTINTDTNILSPSKNVEKETTRNVLNDQFMMIVQLGQDGNQNVDTNIMRLSSPAEDVEIVVADEDNYLNEAEIQDISNDLMLVDNVILEELSDSALLLELDLDSQTYNDINSVVCDFEDRVEEATTSQHYENDLNSVEEATTIQHDENDLNSVEEATTIQHDENDLNSVEEATTIQHDENDLNSVEEATTIQNDENDLNAANVDTVRVVEKKKRRKFETPLCQRKKEKENSIKEKHSVKPPCSDKCKKKCLEHFDESQRNKINEQFWAGSFIQRKSFILNTCERSQVKRRTKDVSDSEFKKKNSFKYFLKDVNDKKHEVCKVFFLTTLGFHKKNDKVVHSVLSKTPKGCISPKGDGRGKNPARNIGPHNEIKEHIESFHPTISHYRREHAPNTRYLPSDVNINFMHSDFIAKYPQHKDRVSYELYRKTVKDMKISFSRLGHEECERCEEFRLHNHDEENVDIDCDLCQTWVNHKDKVKKSRELYQKFSKPVDDEFKALAENPNTIVVSADLQKIIMIPRIDMFKTVLFTPRLIVYHETFAPVGKTANLNPHAVLWHEATTGRNKEDIVSALYAFLKKNRDVNDFIIWLDNCSAQNKNWCLLSFLVYAVNCSELDATTIRFIYFEPGHSYMSADSFHHQVELSLKKQSKTYDFEDFVEAVSNANSKKVDIIKMDFSDFFTYPDCSSQPKLKVTTGRPYLKEIVELKATRNDFSLKYKTDYNDEEYKNLDFLKKKCMTKMPDPVQNTTPAGFPRSKRDNLLKNLGSVIPDNRKDFWLKLPVV